jgi:Protein of unknown function (DUF1194)
MNRSSALHFSIAALCFGGGPMLFRTLFAFAAWAAAPFAAQAQCADLALVLAVDSSGSIDAADYALQRQGYAMAFADPTVQAALQSAGTVDVALVLWGDSELSPQVFGWQRIRKPDDAAQVAATLLYAPRNVTGNTGIGRGVSVALDLLAAPGNCALRKVINVSGDGVETLSPHPRNHVPLATARARAAEMGVMINALAITRQHPDLAEWYTTHLITGTGSFVIAVDDFSGFGDAIIRKLGREIAPPQLATSLAPPPRL